MPNTIRDLCDTKQKPKKYEKHFPSKIHDAFNRCGNVFPLRGVPDMYVDGLSAGIISLIQRLRDIQEGCKYMEWEQNAKS